MHRLELSFSRSFKIVLAITTIIVGASACSPLKGQALIGSASKTGGATSSSSGLSPAVQTQINAVNQQFNSQDSYALAAEDVALLKDQGVLAVEDEGKLRNFIKQ